ncbi:hypothetical protein Acsp03_49830 [Actinomadura sp. NBRC 104412]|uniref:ABC transporter substrate-binding protein n=1 Tax=Actinomadura sp. NBRC 104412 TaxID=3032203 RepID=UPI0024A115F7|nr:extracellular solute-binding protein [Actinomadura sp. NBRC 104412]GLZ07517.1 hypothetical protein Acsp03_49830 [Actinomadura sp. NBRC 104412]
MLEQRRRRTGACVATGVALAVIVSGCGSGAGSAGGGREDRLVVAAVGSQLGTAYKQILQDFGRERGVKVTYFESSVPTTLTKLGAQVPAGKVQFDVAMLNDQAGAEAKVRRLTQPLDPAKVPNLKLLPDYAKPASIDGPLTALSLLGIAYSPKQFRANDWAPPTRWEDFTDPKYGNCVIPPDPVNAGSGVVALALVNKALGGDYGAIDATVERLRPSAKKVPAVTGNLAQTLQMMSQGTACMGLGTQGVALEARAEGTDLAFVAPKGNSAVGLPLVVPKGAAHPNLAQDFINYVLGAKAQQVIVDRALWAPVRPGVKGTVPLAGEIIGPDRFADHDVRPIPPTVFADTAGWGRKFSELFGR